MTSAISLEARERLASVNSNRCFHWEHLVRVDAVRSLISSTSRWW